MTRIHLLCNTLVLLVLTADGLASPARNATAPIKILTLDWTSQIVLSHIAGRLLQQRGYEVKYVSRDSDSQWFLLSSGHADLQMEVWEGSMSKRFVDLLSRQLIVDAGSHQALTREEWWFPDYVKALCPGLPDWRALNDCAGVFAPQGESRGLYYTGPWEKPDRARIRALGLNFDVKQLRDSDALREQLVAAIESTTPIMIFNWTPNWIEAVYAGEFVEFPAHSIECETNPAWGVNSDLAWDCGNPSDGWLKKAVSRQLKAERPCAFEVISHLAFDNQQIAAAAAYVEIDHLAPDAAARRWLDDNSQAVQSWLAAIECQAE